MGTNLRFLPSEVSARSLQVAGAMVLLVTKVDPYIIQILGHWRSNEMFRYLHLTAEPIVKQFAKKTCSTLTTPWPHPIWYHVTKLHIYSCMCHRQSHCAQAQCCGDHANQNPNPLHPSKPSHACVSDNYVVHMPAAGAITHSNQITRRVCICQLLCTHTRLLM